MQIVALALLVGVIALAAACGGDDDSEPAAGTDAPAAESEGSEGAQGDGKAGDGDIPPALAENRAQANEIIDGSTEALEAKLADLRGHPVVVNQWGSWCPPCRAEFPFFAESAEAHAADVAFVGVDIQDDRGAAEAFLEEFPTPYPHIFDEDTNAVRSIEWRGVSPTTWFIDEQGEVLHQRPGAYPGREELEADIESFLLGG